MTLSSDPVQRLVDRQQVVDTVTRLFVETDRKNWFLVAMLFTDAVRFDMTSLTGGEPATLSGEAIADAWKTGLDPVKAVHHQAGNYLVDVEGDEATVFCSAIATHYTPDADKTLTTFVGSYDLHLVRVGDRWKIDAFRYDSRYVI